MTCGKRPQYCKSSWSILMPSLVPAPALPAGVLLLVVVAHISGEAVWVGHVPVEVGAFAHPLPTDTSGGGSPSL